MITFKNLGIPVYKKRDVNNIGGIILHNPGRGLWSRWKKENQWATFRPELAKELFKRDPNELPDYTGCEKWTFKDWKKRQYNEPYPFDTAIRVYASLMKEGPHFLICGVTGRVAQGCPLDLAAWHVGSGYQMRYKASSWLQEAPWWGARYPHSPSPKEAFPWAYTQGTVNASTIGIEVCPGRAGWDKPFSEEFHVAYVTLKTQLESDFHTLDDEGFPHTTHSAVSPLARTLKNKPTDLPETQYDYEKGVLR